MTAATTVPQPEVRTRVISSYVVAPGSQAAIDACRLVLWWKRPLWLAGHDYCGFSWLAAVPVGQRVQVTSGPAKGTYVVTAHRTLNRRSGALPHFAADLVLQTCITGGTGFSLLNRVS